ncbi:peptide ABC transporter ATP-binding protein [Candidatus Magnetomorum sp. HK-1]|nr:peptide ABC transporter ATP-binding protein [Candidatus Magnetomorum sp. HK-1]
MNTEKSLLTVQNLSIDFKTDDQIVQAVKDVSFDLNPGEILGLVGESGSGKTVTALSILRLIPMPPGKIRSGIIQYQDKDLLSMSIQDIRKIRGKQISMIFQEPMSALSPLHRIGHQLVEQQKFHQDIDKKTAWERAKAQLHQVGVPDVDERMYNYPFQLSGGLQQRVMIAMAFMMNPEIIIADEPTTALDVTIQAQIFECILEMKTNQTSILMITHDMGVVWNMCDRMMVMYASRIVEQGPVKQIFANPAHPYTRGLLASIPSLSKTTRKLPVIPGQVPDMAKLPDGCAFYDRCTDAQDICKQKQPVLKNIAENWQSACFMKER